MAYWDVANHANEKKTEGIGNMTPEELASLKQMMGGNSGYVDQRGVGSGDRWYQPVYMNSGGGEGDQGQLVGYMGFDKKWLDGGEYWGEKGQSYDLQGNYLNDYDWNDDEATKNFLMFAAAVGGMQFLPGGAFGGPALSAPGASSSLAGDVLSKAALDGTNIFGANSIPGALDITALSQAGTTAEALQAASEIARQSGYTMPNMGPQAPGSPGGGPPGAPPGAPPSGPGGGPPGVPPGSSSILDAAKNLLPGASSLIGPALAVAGGAAQASAAKKAAATQKQSADDALALMREMYYKNIELQEPFRSAGVSGINRLAQELGIGGDPNADGYGSLLKSFSMDDFETDPGYGFRQSEGEKAIARGMAARGLNRSGRAIKDLTRFNQGLATDEYGNAYNRFRANQGDKFNRLASVAGVGQTATNQVGNAGQQFGQQGANTIMAGGNAQAAGQVGQANAWSNAIGQGYSMYQNNQLMNQLLK